MIVAPGHLLHLDCNLAWVPGSESHVSGSASISDFKDNWWTPTSFIFILSSSTWFKWRNRIPERISSSVLILSSDSMGKELGDCEVSASYVAECGVSSTSPHGEARNHHNTCQEGY